MPIMIRVYIRSILIGIGLACCFVAALLALNVANLRHLVMSNPGGWLAVGMLVVFNAIVFAGVQFAIVVMGQAEPPKSSGGRMQKRPVAVQLAAASHRQTRGK